MSHLGSFGNDAPAYAVAEGGASREERADAVGWGEWLRGREGLRGEHSRAVMAEEVIALGADSLRVVDGV